MHVAALFTVILTARDYYVETNSGSFDHAWATHSWPSNYSMPIPSNRSGVAMESLPQ